MRKRTTLASDFNLSYLNELFSLYKRSYNIDQDTKFEKLETPTLEFTLAIKVDFNDNDLMTNLSPFISISEGESGTSVSIRIVVKIVYSEETAFKEEVKRIFNLKNSEGNTLDHKQQFEMFYLMLSKTLTVLKMRGIFIKLILSIY
jgi:phosphopantetheinyl transferase